MSPRPHSLLRRNQLMLGVSLGAMALAGTAMGAGNPYPAPNDPAAQVAQAVAARAGQNNAANAASQRAVAAFAQASAIRRMMDTNQLAARAMAAASAAKLGIPNGLGAGGLQVDPGVAGDPSLWLNAKAPTQSTGADGRTKVDVEQTDKQAILNWKSFNVGQDTDLSFNQQSSSWVVLNRVTDPSADPTRILGTIKAPGTVLIMNRNGVIFGGTSQINVGGLIAGAAKISDAQFLKNGIYSTMSGVDYLPVFTDALGQVKVDAGAQLTTSTPTTVLQGGGSVMLIGGSVENDGSITTPRGQTLLAAGDSFALRTGLGSASNAYSTTRGSEIAPSIAADSVNGTAINTGSIFAQQGDITIAGRTVTQAGVALSTSTVSTRGTIHLLNSASDADGSVTLTGNSYTAILPELDSTETALDSQRDSLIADSAVENQARLRNSPEFNNLSMQADREDQGRIEIVSGGSVEFQGGSLSQAQGGQIAASATGRLQVDTGAILDVSGVQNVALDVASNNIKINIQGNELRDSPVNRDAGSLFNSDVWIDARDLIEVPGEAGAADRWYTAGGLIEVSGYVGNTGHGIGEWSAPGGSIALSGLEVVAQKGSLFNVAGGSLNYQAGDVIQTLLQGADGQMYTADTAPANIQMVSVGKSFQVLHPRWGAQYTETFQNPFTQTQIVRHEDGYLVGRDAGQLIVSAPTVLFEGDIEAEVFTGDLQVNAHPQGETDGYKLGQTQAPLSGGISIGKYDSRGLAGAFDTDVKIGADIPDVGSSLGLSDAIADDRQNTAWLDAGRLSGFGLGGISVATAGGVTVDAPLTLANGGALTLIGSTVDINADVTARSGAISVSNFIKLSPVFGGGVLPFVDADGGAHATVGKGVTLDLRGLWVNAVTDPGTASDLAFVDGGDLTLDTSQDVTVEEGAVIDVSSGGGLTASGKIKGGRGGDVTLIAGDPVTSNGGPASTLTLKGVIHAEGVSGGGTLTLSEPGTVLIGDDASLSGGQLTLAAGTPAHVNLTLAEALTIPAGVALPMAFSQTLSSVPLDTPTTITINAPFGMPGGPITLIGPWDSTAGMGNIFGTDASGGSIFTLGAHHFNAGDTITGITGTFPIGTVFPSSAWPRPMPSGTYTVASPAGAVLTTPTTYAAGTTVPAGTTFNVPVPILPVLSLSSDAFHAGFANYVVNGGAGLLITDGTHLTPEMPVYQITGDSLSVRSGADPASAMSSWTPPLFLENPQTASLTQRQGASLTLQSIASSTGADSALLPGGGAIVVSDGASITVDPGQSIKLDAFGQITVQGDLTAHGGTIRMINEATGGTEISRQFDQAGNIRGFSIWIGDGAVLDTSGLLYTAKDQYGRSYGVAGDGGTIQLGGSLTPGPNNHFAETEAFVIVRPGAELNADGVQMVIDPQAGGSAPAAGTPLTIASNGGSIVMDSYSGFYLDGNIHAKAGGPGASGGALSISLESPVFGFTNPASIIQPISVPVGVLNVVQEQPESPLPDDIAPGTHPESLKMGQGTVSADMIDAGGFDSVTLNSRDFLQFTGDVTLTAGRSISLITAGIISGPLIVNNGPYETDPANPFPTPSEHVVVSAPYVLLNSPTIQNNDNTTHAVVGAPGTYNGVTDATFEVDAGLIDVQGTVNFSANIFTTATGAGFVIFNGPGFADVKLTSQGDIRFLAPIAAQGATTSLETPWDLELTAAQLYPGTNAVVWVGAGTATGSAEAGDKIGKLTISRIDGVDPNLPQSLFGQITLDAPVIEQGGVVRAPLGAVTLGGNGNGFHGLGGAATQILDFLPGSITSVSADGLSMPYGGTPDGVNYSYNNAPITPNFQVQGVILDSVSVDVQQGATLDTSGGGDIKGAAFIPGRGGSVDILKTPLVNANPKSPFSASSDKVYAIIPGYDAKYAPNNLEKGFGDPAIGQQVTIPAGVPGLPAGTYTLLPSNYALMPGAYRVEIGKAASPNTVGVTNAGNGVYATAGYTSFANSNERSSLPQTLLIMSGAAVRDTSQYDEQGYADFIQANIGALINGQVINAPIPLPADAKKLIINLEGSSKPRTRPAFNFDGVAITNGAEGGSSGTVQLAAGGDFEVYSDASTDGFTGVSVDAADLNAIHAPSLNLSGSNLFVRPGVTLQGSQLILSASGNIDIQAGAILTTIGQGDAPSSAALPQSFNSTTLALSNSELNITGASGSGSIIIEGGAGLFAGDTLAFATNGKSTVDNSAEFGAKNIALAVSAINIGSVADLAAAGNPDGLLFDQSLFNFLVHGDPAHGAPALERLTLSATNAINLFGDASLDAGGTGVDLVLNTPAIYGFGGAGDHAVIAASKITWNSVAGANPPAILPGGAGTGLGRFDLRADEIDFGSIVAGVPVSANRTLYGFGTVNLIATTQIVSTGSGGLWAYQAPGADPAATFGQGGVGGDLNIITPILTSAAKSIMAYTAGGVLKVSSPVGSVSSATSTIGGGEIDLDADSVGIDSTILLPSGKLAVTAVHDIDLGAQSRIDLAGRPSQVLDATVYGFGGSAVFTSNLGGMTQVAGSVIDVSATQSAAGSIQITADQGAVVLGGSVKGTSDQGFSSGAFNVKADVLPDFAGLNATLNAGGVYDARIFDIKTGDLVVGDGVKARDVEISLDGGLLTVNGTIDASGAGPGIIRLAGKTGLTLAGSAVLDAHGTVLQIDSYGAPIEAKNRGHVELAAAQGMLTLASGATIDLSTPDGVARGQVELDALRTGETSGDINIDASGPLTLRGAASIAVNGFWKYSPTDTYGTIVQDNGEIGGATVNADGWLGMNQVDLQSQAFMTAAAGNGGLQGRLTGLKAYGDAFHLRPGVEIDSSTPDGNLTIAGDIDLASFRYGANADRNPNSATYGRGEPGALVIRAGGDLDIVGSISDGFRPAPATGDDNNWLLLPGSQTSDVETLLPIGVNGGSTFPNTAGLKLRYDIPINASTIKAGAVLPVEVVLSADYTVPAGTRLTAPVLGGGGTLYPAGTVFAVATTIPAGSRLEAGSKMPTSFGVAAMTWPKGAPLDVFNVAVNLSTSITVPFEGVIPTGANILINGDSAPTRPTGAGGSQGSLLALGPMLPGGDLSWSIRGVAGADLQAADTRVVRPQSVLKAHGVSGNLTLADTHHTQVAQPSYYLYNIASGAKYGPYSNNYYCSLSGYFCTTGPTTFALGGPEASVLRTGTGDLDLIAGGSFSEQSLYGVYTAGTQSAPILAPDGTDPYNQPRGLLPDGTLLTSANADKAQVALDTYAAWYPEHGGDVFLSAQADVGGKVVMENIQQSQPLSNFWTDSDLVTNWLWRQGGGGVATQPTAWWINFGTFAHLNSFGADDASLVGFQGVGTLGGGNLTVTAGGNAGTASLQGDSNALNLAVGSTGRVLADGTLVQTGGGDLTLKVGGVINPGVPDRNIDSSSHYGVITDLRGDINISAGGYGDVTPTTIFSAGLSPSLDPRTPETGVFRFSLIFTGPTLIPGDGKVTIATRGDLALGGVGDATTVTPVDSFQAGSPYTQINPDGTTTFVPGGGATTFTLWRPNTAIDLFSAGGDVSPTQGGLAQNMPSNAPLGFYPGTLIAAAPNGDIRVMGGGPDQVIELAPSPVGQLELLAGHSIYGSGMTIAMSGASMDSLATPQHPAFSGALDPDTFVPLSNASPTSPYYGGDYKQGANNPIAFGPDTPTDNLHAGDDKPALVYAGVDIDDLAIGHVQSQSTGFGINPFTPVPNTWYIAAKPFDVIAGRDIVGLGQGQLSDAYYNVDPNDITEIHAGRDIIFKSAVIAGPGLLDVQAGRDVFQGFRGVFDSVGPQFDVDPTKPTGGAGISVAAGVGPNGPDYSEFARLYFDAANQLPGDGTPLADSGKVAHAYNKELLAWLQQRFGYAGSDADALTYFLALPSAQQGVFVRQVYYEELTLGGREFNDPTSSRFNSYLRGRNAIATLFPTKDADGNPIAYDGTLTMYSGQTKNSLGQTVTLDSGIRTDFGGDVQILNPGGQTILGVEGLAPGSLAGLLTQGEGNIDIYAEGSILLGQSRILTTFGGDILAWSASGDINSGRGSKTSIIFSPPRRVYDPYGNVTVSSPVPSTGAGIGTLNPIPEVPPGDVDLIAPLGTVDAGEAGIRVSGDINIAALHVVNAANIQVQGNATGLPQAVVVNTGALTSASNAASAVSTEAERLAERARPQMIPRVAPTILTVKLLGFGDNP